MITRLLIIVATFLSLTAVARADESLTFERHIRPLLKVHCLDCHGATAEVEGDLDLRLRRFMVAGGDSGPAIEPGNPDESLLIQRIRDGEMPPGDKKMSAEELAVLEKWIAAGAETAREEPEKLDPGLGITPEEREFWSFQPLSRPEVPKVNSTDRVRNPIDAFIAAKLQELELDFSADADQLTLLNRAYFDLHGLPPTPEEIAAYLADESADKYEKLIETLLASPRYGERWARHWLDVAGYADTEGYSPADADRAWVYKYRDYVIKSLNEDKPFNVFLEEQLAGDELVPQPHKNLSEDQIEKLVATGFLRMAGDGTGSGANDDMARNQTISDTIKIVSSSLLGMSVGCAQCHDHRYDPISHVDYYQMRAIFEPALNWKAWRTPPQRLISLWTDEDRKAAAEIEEEAKKIISERDTLRTKYIEEELEIELKKYDQSIRDKLRVAYHTATDKRTDEQKQLLKENPAVNISAGTLYQYNQKKADEIKEFDKRIGEVRAKKPPQEFVRALTEIHGQVPKTHLFYRGEFKQPMQEVNPAGLTISSPPGESHEIPLNSEEVPTTGRRLSYARWLFSGSHPLVGRVLANRMWMHHMGRGIVGTPADFGTLGLRPTHPKLLDWLAVEFAESGWSLKDLHRKIMLSTIYRQSSQSDPAKMAIDGANLWYWKKPIIRLDAEAIHDRLLATSGILEHKLYGPAVPITADDTGQTVVSGDSKRRSIYVKVKRTQPVALLKSFDAPVMEVNCDCRPSSTVATQSLMLMNSGFILDQSKAFAERVAREASAVAAPKIAFDQSQLANPIDAWQFGYGEYSPDEQKIVAFTPLPHWTGTTWQGGEKLPNEQLGWVSINADGGHPGDLKHSPIRRWTAPATGTVKVTGKLIHGSENGDGVSARVVSSRDGMIAEWIARHSDVQTPAEGIQVQAGDVLDFHLDCRTSVTSDSFGWTVKIELATADGKTKTWDSKTDFHGPRAEQPSLPQQVVRAWQLAFGRPPSDNELAAGLEFLVEQFQTLLANSSQPTDVTPELQIMTNLCQVLLSSNEFLYVD